MALIEVSHIAKEYEVLIQQPGAGNILKNIFCPDRKTVHAVKDVSFTIQEGELVGFIGENGAGKSTTIKMMAGISVCGNAAYAGLLSDAGKTAESWAENEGGGGTFFVA